MKDVKLTRQELYDLVWGESMLSLAKKFIISDVGLRKKCRSLEIPVPNAGYWAKVKYGKKVAGRRPLGDFKGEQTALLKLREDENEHALSHAGLKKIIEKDIRINLIVPEKLINPDKMIVTAKEYFNRKDVIKEDKLYVRSSQNEIRIIVRPNTLEKALLFMDTLIKAIRIKGFDIKISDQGSFFVYEREEYQFFCHENLEEIPGQVVFKKSEIQYTSQLCLYVKFSRWNAHEWEDGKKPLEKQISSIIATLELKGRKSTEERIAREKYRADEKAKELKEKAIQDTKERELDNFKELFKKAKRHDKAEMIRSYANKLEQNAIDRNELTFDLREKIEWAKKKADWYDPFIEADDELLRGIDREELKLEKKSFYWLKE
jgi:hypothetical protein